MKNATIILLVLLVCGQVFGATGTYHPADTNNNYKIGIRELLAYIDRWAAGEVSMLKVLEALELYHAGHYYWDESRRRFKPGYKPNNNYSRNRRRLFK